jgi:hypothetical protein
VAQGTSKQKPEVLKFIKDQLEKLGAAAKPIEIAEKAIQKFGIPNTEKKLTELHKCVSNMKARLKKTGGTKSRKKPGPKPGGKRKYTKRQSRRDEHAVNGERFVDATCDFMEAVTEASLEIDIDVASVTTRSGMDPETGKRMIYVEVLEN